MSSSRREERYVPPPVVTKEVHAGSAFYTLQWSPLAKVDKYRIINTVPSEAGIFELYYMDDRKRLVLMMVSRVWYGGLRSRLRGFLDPDVEKTKAQRDALENRECYYRYSIIRSFDDMKDVLFFFAGRHTPDRRIEHSGRYEEIFLDERSPNKITTI